MKFFYAALILLATLFIGSTAQAIPIPLRGVVEGFYGTPWDFNDRADIINFCRQNNLNAYIYAPKDDPFHREKWRTPYPTEKLSEMRQLVAVAKKNNVRFIFAVSPGLDLNYNGKKGDDDFNFLLKKIDAMYKIGVRDFAIFFDDLKDDKGRHHENGEDHAKFLNRLQKTLNENYRDIAPLITVPTEYFSEDMLKGKKVKPYTKDLAENLDPSIVVLFSGRGVVCDGITDEELAEVNKIFGREVGIWWNYPVNDYSLTPNGERNVKLALGAIEKLPKANMTAIFFNPMGQVQMSKIALGTGAIYANNPANYDENSAWNKIIDVQFGSLAPEMKIFAEHSRHMENSWAKVGSPDAPDFHTTAYLLLHSLGKKSFIDFAPMDKKIAELQSAVDLLLKNLPKKYLSECKPQLEQLQRIARADKIALESLKAGKIDPKLKILREEIAVNEKQAVISEESARKFIDDVIKFFDEQEKNSRKKK